jgi:phosphoglycolate phosphatase-like HAD superfamily hydrolase
VLAGRADRVNADAFWERKRHGATTAGALEAVGLTSDLARDLAAAWQRVIEDDDLLQLDPLLPGARSALALVRERGLRSVILTARQRSPAVRRQIDALGLASLCDAVHVVRPSAATTEKAAVLRSLNSLAFIGDTESDAVAAAAAQVPFVAVASGMRSPTFLGDQHVRPIYADVASAVRSVLPR